MMKCPHFRKSIRRIYHSLHFCLVQIQGKNEEKGNKNTNFWWVKKGLPGDDKNSRRRRRLGLFMNQVIKTFSLEKFLKLCVSVSLSVWQGFILFILGNNLSALLKGKKNVQKTGDFGVKLLAGNKQSEPALPEPGRAGGEILPAGVPASHTRLHSN